jgi:membrane protease YdiL (CAAX protease family)
LTSLTVVSNRWSLWWVIGGYVVANVSAAVAVGLWAGAFGDAGIAAVLIGSIGLWVGFVGAPWLASRVEGTGDVRADFTARVRWVDVPVGVLTGVGLQLVVLPALYWLVQLATGPLDVDGPAAELADRAGGPAGWALFAVVVGLGAPVAEELYFRGLLRGTLDSRWGSAVGVVGSSALFAATHFQVVQFVGLFVAGLVWALLAHRAGRLGPAVVSHMAFNLSTVALLYVA